MKEARDYRGIYPSKQIKGNVALVVWIQAVEFVLKRNKAQVCGHELLGQSGLRPFQPVEISSGAAWQSGLRPHQNRAKAVDHEIIQINTRKDVAYSRREMTRESATIYLDASGVDIALYQCQWQRTRSFLLACEEIDSTEDPSLDTPRKKHKLALD